MNNILTLQVGDTRIIRTATNTIIGIGSTVAGPVGPAGPAGAQGADGPQGPIGTGGVLGFYGAFSDSNDQTAAANTATAMLLGTTDEANGVSIVSGSQITFANVGTYNLQWSAQFVNTGNADHDVSVWMRKNGTDVAGSTGIVSVPGKHGGINGHILPSWNFVFTVAAGDYYQFYWSTPDTDVTIQAFPSAVTPTRPATASIVVTATQVMYTQAGPTGPTGVVTATAPVTYDSGTQTVALSTGTGLTTSAGALVPDFGTSSGKVTQGDDSRLTDARTPTAHASSHHTGGSDALSGPAIGAVPLTWTTGQYEKATWGTQGVGALPMVLNRMYASAIYVPRGASIDRVAVEVQVVGTAGSVVRMGLYANGTNGVGGLLFDAGTVDSATSTGWKDVTVSWTNLTGDIYWLVAVAQVAAPTVRSVATNTGLGGFGPYNVGLNNAPDRWQVFQNAAASGALPSTFTIFAATDGPIMLVRVG